MSESYTSTAPKPFVFVLMPFDSSFDDIYKFGIKGAAEDVQAYAERVDEQNFDESILQRIVNQIAKSDVIVADMSGRNPNVFYEVGYAHALGKLAILLTKSADDIPFDLKHRPHIVYDGQIQKLRTKLADRLKWAIAESKSLARSTENIESAIDGFVIEVSGRIARSAPIGISGPRIEYPRALYPSGRLALPIVLRNTGRLSIPSITSAQILVEPDSTLIPIELEKEMEPVPLTPDSISLNNPDERNRLADLGWRIPSIPPGVEHSLKLGLQSSKSKIFSGDVPIRLRIRFVEYIREYPFVINFSRNLS